MADQLKLTRREIRTLNAARTILSALEERAGDTGYALAREAANVESYDGGSRAVMACGRVAQAADAAESAVFKVLNIARSYADIAITDDEMFNRQPEAKAQKQRADESSEWEWLPDAVEAQKAAES
jgi:hypothetical protein